MVSVFFLKSNTLQSMLVDYAVTEMDCFDDYSDSAPRAKTMRGGFYYYLSFARCPMYHFQSNKISYSNTYCQGMVEVIIFKVRFQGY